MRPAPSQTSPALIREGEGGEYLAGAERRRRHRGEAAEDEEGDTTHDVLLKYLDETLATYI